MIPLLALAGVGWVAWQRADSDRTAGLKEQALGMAEVLKGAALEATTALEAAEEQLAGRLAAAARRADADLADAHLRERHVRYSFFSDPDDHRVELCGFEHLSAISEGVSS